MSSHDRLLTRLTARLRRQHQHVDCTGARDELLARLERLKAGDEAEYNRVVANILQWIPGDRPDKPDE